MARPHTNQRRKGPKIPDSKTPGKHILRVSDTGASCSNCGKGLTPKTSCPNCGPFAGYKYTGHGKAPKVKGLVYLGAA